MMKYLTFKQKHKRLSGYLASEYWYARDDYRKVTGIYFEQFQSLYKDPEERKAIVEQSKASLKLHQLRIKEYKKELNKLIDEFLNSKGIL